MAKTSSAACSVSAKRARMVVSLSAKVLPRLISDARCEETSTDVVNGCVTYFTFLRSPADR